VDPKYTVKLDRTVGRWVYPLHRQLYERTGGRIGHRSMFGPILLLTTTGRRSGQARTTPLLYMPDAESFWVVASNGGRPETPSWLHNLRALPEATVQAGTNKVDVDAEILAGPDRERIWSRLTEYYRGWSYYQQLTDRQLPAVHLTRRR
jgi:F420H(2)-dependent quinone reductase